ncbi:MAG: type II toxin-antitoxin system VapC family toxin [Candidatus Methanodesulfokora sp.]|jgi:predicted nucleic acid-binding protein
MAYLVDADILYGYVDPADWLHEYAVKFFDNFKDIKTSVIVVLELAVVIKRELPNKLFEILKTLDKLNVEILPVNDEITRAAFDFMQRGFGIFDSFHASTAKYYGLTIVSTDHKYRSIGLSVLDPRNL